MESRPPILTTARTRLRLPRLDDGPFMLRLLNDPEFVRFTGDRGIRDLEGAESYIEQKMLGLQRQHGFTLYLVERLTDEEPLGICGLVKRPNLDAPDIGFGYLTEHSGQGIGTETAKAVLEFAYTHLGHRRIYGITQPDNAASMRLLEKIGLKRQRTQHFPGLAERQVVFRIQLRPLPRTHRAH
ncbi:MAG: GNAT family N-acetyltransferase [Synoicihabitans sp.]